MFLSARYTFVDLDPESFGCGPLAERGSLAGSSAVVILAFENDKLEKTACLSDAICVLL